MLARFTGALDAAIVNFPPITQALIAPPIEGSDLTAIPPEGDSGLFMPGSREKSNGQSTSLISFTPVRPVRIALNNVP
jgi:hypothetical protein